MIRLALRNLARTTVAGTTSVEMGDLSIETKAHAHDGSMYDTLPASDQLLAQVRGVPGVRAVAPRLLAFGLVGREARSQSALFIGVDASAEATASNVPKAVLDGGWLPDVGPAGRPVVLGEGLARLLAARVGDELVVLLQTADGSMGDDRLHVVGVARTVSCWRTIPGAARSRPPCGPRFLSPASSG